jgi:uncharacterized protein YjbI with pentapeptide repeats
VANCSFQNIIFNSCKILGVDFSKVNQFLLSFEFNRCILNLSNFSGLKIKKTKFVQCTIEETYFEDIDLSESDFSESNLLNSKFVNANLTKANFVGAVNYMIDPRLNKIAKARFSIAEAINLLKAFDITIEY